MRKFFKRIRKRIDQGKIPKMDAVLKRLQHPINNQDGSIIFIALMIMVVMTVIGLMTSDMAVTENMIIRNQGIYKQNINMVEAALSQTIQNFMAIPPEDPLLNNIDHTGTSGTDFLPWIGSKQETWASTTWYTLNTSNSVLNSTNSVAVGCPCQANLSSCKCTLKDRHEEDSGNLRTGFIGWDPVSSESLKVGSNVPSVKQGRLVAEYVCRRYKKNGVFVEGDHGFGMLRMEAGVRRHVMNN